MREGPWADLGAPGFLFIGVRRLGVPWFPGFRGPLNGGNQNKNARLFGQERSVLRLWVLGAIRLAAAIPSDLAHLCDHTPNSLPWPSQPQKTSLGKTTGGESPTKSTDTHTRGTDRLYASAHWTSRSRRCRTDISGENAWRAKCERSRRRVGI